MLDSKQISKFANQTVTLAQQNVLSGGLPFSAIIVNRNGDCIGKGVNQVKQLHDCTAHAEIQAIRAASKNLGQTELTGSTLFASGEPCGLCYATIRLAKISHVVILLDRHEVEQLGFDYLWTYQLHDKKTTVFKVNNLPNELKIAPFIQSQQRLYKI